MNAPQKPDNTPAALATRAVDELSAGAYETANTTALVTAAAALVAIAETLAAHGALPGPAGLTPNLAGGMFPGDPIPPGADPLDEQTATDILRAVIAGRMLEAIESWPDRAWLAAGTTDLAQDLAEHIARQCTAESR